MKSHPNYELFEELGRTDTTVVYRAHDLALGRDVAIKELTEHGKADPHRQERFLREARFLAQTEHAGILRIHTVVPEQGWIVMELMKGNLAAQIESAPMTADTVRSILRQILEALDFLHGRGKLHGSIRPSNILIDAEGTVRLSDFEQTDLDGELRTPTSSKKYLAPEWIQSEFGDLGPQSDLYCLAFTAIELLAGKKFDSLVLDGQSAAMDPEVAWLRKHCSTEPWPPIAMLIPKIPPDLAATLDAMLQKQVDDRPASAAAAMAKLNEQPIVVIEPAERPRETPVPAGIMPTSVREIDPLASKSRRANATTQTTADRQDSKRKRAVAAASGKSSLHQTLEKPYVLYPLCALILIGALGVGLYLRGKKDNVPPAVAELPDKNRKSSSGEPAENETPTEPEASSEPSTPSETTTTDGEDVTDPTEDKNESGTDPDVSEANETQIAEEVKAETETIEETPLREKPVDPAENAELATDPTEKTGGQPESPPESQIKPDEEDNTTDIALETGDKATPVPEEPEIGEPEIGEAEIFEPETDSVESFLELVSKEVEVDTAELLKDFKGDPELVLDAGAFLTEVSDVAIDPRGRWVAACGEKVVRVWSLENGQLVATLRGDRSRTSYGNCNTLAFSPDGEHLVVGVSDYQPHGAIRVYRAGVWDEIEALLPGHTSPIRQLDFSRDGQLMTSADADGNIAVWDWKQRQQLAKTPPRDPQAPIIDQLHFAGTEPILFAIDVAGPYLLDASTMRLLTAADPLPPRSLGWMYDILTDALAFPYPTKDSPRVVDLRLDQNVWAAAGVGKENGENKFWIGLWNAREMEAPPQPDPFAIYRGHRWEIRSIDLAPGLGLAASVDKYGEVHLWAMENGENLLKFRCEAKSIYEAAFDRNSSRIAYGTKAYGAERWARQNYGSIDKVLDLSARSIFPSDVAEPIDPIQETPTLGNEKLQVKRIDGDAGLSVLKLRNGETVGRYDLATGRIPTVLSLLEQPAVGVREPAIIGDNDGLLAVWDTQSDQLRRAFIGHDAMVTAVSVAPNGKALLSSSADRTIRLWSLENHVPTGRFDFKYENAVVTDVVAGSSSAQAGVQVGDRIESIDGKSITEMYELMLTGNFEYRPGDVVPVQMVRDDQPYSFNMQLDAGYDFSEPILSVFIDEDQRWIVWTPQGYYDAAPGAEDLIGWHINRGPEKAAAYFSVGQFREQLYRPDIINRVLSGQNIEAAVRDANEAGDEAAEFDFRSPSDLALQHPPAIEIVSPGPTDEWTGGVGTLEVIITSPNGLPIREVTLLVDGVTVESFEPKSAAEIRMDVEHPIRLTPGNHTVEWVAANSRSRGFATTRIAVPEPAADEISAEEAAPPATNLIVLAIGVPARTLSAGDIGARAAVEDAKYFAETMKLQSGGDLYRNVTDRVLLGPQATRAAILDGFQWLVDQTDSGDTVAIYIASDAFIDSSENFYIGTHDVDTDRPRATAISWREFIKTLHTDLPGCKRLIFLDLNPDQQALEPGLRNPLLDLAAPELGTVFFSSTALQQRLPSRDEGRSFLTAALRQTLGDQSADFMPKPPDGLLNCEEASIDWTEKVRGLSSGKLYPIAFAPAASRPVNVFQLRGSEQTPDQP